MYTIQNIASVLACEAAITNPTDVIQYLGIDSRRISFPDKTLFFSIVTSHGNGHLYIQEAYEMGVRNFCIQESINIENYPEANFITVHNTIESLQQLATFHSNQFNIPTVGITGSNGKTIVKEWLYQLLQEQYNIVRSPRSYNSQLGVPLSIWQINSEHNLGIFEAGISQEGEMQVLEKIIHPTIGILTNVKEAHNQGFGSKTSKAIEKLQLFQQADLLICNLDEPWLDDLIQNNFKGTLFSWGNSKVATVRIEHITKGVSTSTIQVIYQNKPREITIGFNDEASIENAITCWCLLLYLNIAEEVIKERMLQIQAVEMRLQLKAGINNCYIINDSYSLDTDSLQIALSFLQHQQQQKSHTVILSDSPGYNNIQQYALIIQMLRQAKVNKAILIGEDWQQNLATDLENVIKIEHYPSTNKFIQNFISGHFRNEIILIKGARRFQFEQIVSLLEKQNHQTVMEINLTALIHNLKQHRQQLQSGTKLMAVIKAFGYGSGSAELASVLQFHKVDYLAVAYVDEGIELRKNGIHLPILVLNLDEAAFQAIIEYNLEPEIFSSSILYAFINFLQQQGIQQYPVHIKLDTGMHRLGFEEYEIDPLIKTVNANNSIIIKSVFTHLVASEDEKANSFTQQQFNLFNKYIHQIEKGIGYSFIKHIGNSAAIYRHPHLQMDMVRLGIGLYGVGVPELQLLPVVTLKTTIAQLRQVKAGETIGYNRRGRVEKDSTIATIRIGYADGFKRELSNGIGKVFIKGKLVPVIGSVCMDMTMIDVTEIDDVQESDEVEIFGENLPVQQVANWCNTISYEILTSIGQRVKRVYLQE